MNILSSLLVALGLSMDNFAVSIASGCCNRKISWRYSVSVSVLFALAHVVMFSAGWFGGRELGRFISSVDHWIAFVVLAFIGARMVWQARGPEETDPELCRVHTLGTLLMLSVATSIDALLVGVGLSFTAAPYLLTTGTLAVCVLLTSLTGFVLGSYLGRRFGRVMEALGGLALVAIGVKLLVEGL